MGGESRYQISIPSKQILTQTKSFHTNSKLFIPQSLACAALRSSNQKLVVCSAMPVQAQPQKKLFVLQVNNTNIKPLLNP